MSAQWQDKVVQLIQSLIAVHNHRSHMCTVLQKFLPHAETPSLHLHLAFVVGHQLHFALGPLVK